MSFSFELSSYLPYQLSIVSSRLSRALEQAISQDTGLSRHEWRILALMRESGTCLAAELVNRSSLDAVAVHRAVKRLQELSLIEKSNDSRDKRSRPLTLTQAGIDKYMQVVPHAIELQNRLLATLGAREAKAFADTMDKLSRWDVLESEFHSLNSAGGTSSANRR